MARLTLPVALLLALSVEGAQRDTVRDHLGVGDPLPRVEISGLTQTDARSLDEFTGRALLIDFVGYWAPVCERSVEFLERVSRELGPRGLTVLALTDDDERKTRAWMAAHGVDYPYAFDASGELHRRLGVRRFPFAVLVDPFGTILWTGNPLSLPDAALQRALARTAPEPAWAWPEPARRLTPELWDGRYAAALAACEDPEAEAIVRERLQAAMAQVEALAAAHEYRAAILVAKRMELGNLPEAARLEEHLHAMLSDPEIRRTADIERELAELERRAEVVRTLRELEAMHKVVAAFVERHAGEPIERRARALLQTLEEALGRPEKD